MIPINAVAVISDDHDDRIDPKPYQAPAESPLADNWDMATEEELEANG
jgi:hypothetical protein